MANDSSPFVHLHAHSWFSFCRGTDPPERLCRAVRERGMEALAITDTNGLYGLIWFLQFARAAGVRPIVGAESVWGGERAVVLVRDGRIEKVGPVADFPIPEGYTLIDKPHHWLLPGLVEAHNHAAGSGRDLHDYVYLTNPGLRTLSALVSPSARHGTLPPRQKRRCREVAYQACFRKHQPAPFWTASYRTRPSFP